MFQSFLTRFFWIPIFIVLTACPKAPKTIPLPGVEPVSKPVFEKTFGDITIGDASSLIIRYKSMLITIDATVASITRTLGSATQIDYFLLTDIQPYHFDPLLSPTLRKTTKIISTTEGLPSLQAQGFSQTKALSGGQRILLKKGEDFLFVTALETRNPASGKKTNGYLLEFDNGKNIFISGDIVDEAVLREFVYSIRDDGKMIEYSFIYGGGFRPEANGPLQSSDEALAAAWMGLLQPRVGFILTSGPRGKTNIDEGSLRNFLKEQMFSGEFYRPTENEVIPF